MMKIKDTKDTLAATSSRLSHINYWLTQRLEGNYDPFSVVEELERKTKGFKRDFPFMIDCPRCGHEAFWVPTKKHPRGRHVCFSLTCDWTSDPVTEVNRVTKTGKDS